MALCVISVFAYVSVLRHAFIEAYVKEVERAYDSFYSVLNVALVIGILDPQKEDSAALMSQSLINECPIEIAQVYESRRARSQPCNKSAFRQISWRIHIFILFGSVCERRIYEFA